jgi:hypothetical protein
MKAQEKQPSPSPTIDATADPAKVWQELKAKIPAPKAFLRTAAAAAHVLGVEGRSFLLGFSPEQKSLMDILGTQTNRKFLENLLKETTGSDWTVKLSVKEDLPFNGPPLPEKSSPQKAADFKNDPLIREALEIFKGEIKTVND